MDNKADLFYGINEPYAAGLFEEENRSPFIRYSRGLRRYWEECSMPIYDKGLLYPCGVKMNDSYAVSPDFSYTVNVDESLLKNKDPRALNWMRQETGRVPGIHGPHTVGGAGYTHSIPNYGRIAREGLDSYELRVQNLLPGDFREGLLDVLAGIRNFHSRTLDYLRTQAAAGELLQALETVPFQPARSLYEALVSWNFIYYIDFCDNPGRLDEDLYPFYKGEDVTPILRALFLNADINNGWSAAIGPECNPLTVQCLRAIKGIRRPSIELRVTDNMPDEVWKAAETAVASGCGSPSFYNESLYQKSLAMKFPKIPREDLLRFNGGGCTETMLAGISNVGSLDAGINLALVFTDVLRNFLEEAPSFEKFYSLFIKKAKQTINDTLDMVSQYQRQRAAFRPHPMRSLLIDDCIDKGMDFNGGGARYYWSVINVAGLINVIDSMLAIRELVFYKKRFTPKEFIGLLEKEDGELYQTLWTVAYYGADNPEADNLAAQIASDIWDMFNDKTPWLGGAFLPSSIQFATYADAGKEIRPTPDGRKRGEPLCDSIAAIHGRDAKGPTALLSSAARLHLNKALGTPVTNIRLNKDFIPKSLKPLVLGYFQKGGMQLQVTCVSKTDMLDALKNPQKHENLIVRIGGYSEYFNRLTPELKQTVIDRTEYS